MNRHHVDEATADRILSGRLAPEDAPPGYAGIAALARAAAGPATRAELSREGADVDAAVAAVVSGLVPLSNASRRRSMIGKLLTAKVAAGATIVALGAGTAAAAISGALPTQATSHANAHAKAGLATAASHVAKAGAPSTTGATKASSSGRQASSGTSSTSSSVRSTGTANRHALFGLCTAFLAGSPASSAGKDASTAFKALIAETGGSATATTAFCKGYVSTNHPGRKPTAAGGRPATAGKPSTAGSSSSHAKVSTPDAGGTATDDQASGGASSAGSGNAGSHPGGR
jgi:hypothetical protein